MSSAQAESQVARPGRGQDSFSHLEGGLFGGRDPFSEFGSMDVFGHDVGVGAFGSFGDVMQELDGMSRKKGGHDLAGMMNADNGQCKYASQSFAMCSRTGPDGKTHTERFSNSEVGDHSQNIREAQQAYSNSASGLEKTALERQLGDRGRKVVREFNRNTLQEKSTELFKGMDESHRDEFDQSFTAKSHFLPQHSRFSQALNGGTASNGALPAGAEPEKPQLQNSA